MSASKWFDRPRMNSGQLSLFPTPLLDLLAELAVSPEECDAWREEGWISIPPDDAHPCEQWQRDELIIVRDVARSGLTRSMVRTLLSELPRPFHYSSDRLAYRFGHGWVEGRASEDPMDIIDTHLDAWLEARATDDDIETLRDLRDKIDNLLETALGNESE